MTSAILTKLAETYPEIPTNPEKYLGPNAPKVLDFWKFIDTLSYKEMEEMWQRYCALDPKVRVSAYDAACDAADEVVDAGFRYVAWNVAWVVTERGIFGYATDELIGDVENKVAYDLIMSYKKS